MRLAFISTMEGVPWGGSEALWSGAAERMVRSNVSVGVCVRQWPETPKRVTDLERAGCQIFMRRPRTLVWRAAHNLGLGRNRDWAWLQKFRPDLAVISLGIQLEGTEASAACLAAGVPYTLIIQAANEHRWPGDEHLDPL